MLKLIRASSRRLLRGGFLEALEFEGAFVQGGGVAVYANGQFEPQFVLGFDHFGEGALMRLLRGFVVNDHRLQLLDEPVDDGATEDQEQEEGGQKEPPVVHAGRVVNGAKEFACVHVGHLFWLIVGELMVERPDAGYWILDSRYLMRDA